MTAATGQVGYQTNELLRAFNDLKMLRYEDVMDEADCVPREKSHIVRIEGGKATDSLRREPLKSLPHSDKTVRGLEERATQQHAFFEWLEKISTGLDLDDPAWLREVSRHYLSRKEPKTDWNAQFQK